MKNETKSRGGVNITIESSPEWRDWVQALASSERCKMSALFDRLAAEHAKRVGFDPPPSRYLSR